MAFINILQAQAALAQYPEFIILCGDSRTQSASGLCGGVGTVNLAVQGLTLEGIRDSQIPVLPSLWSIPGALGVYLDGGVNNMTGLITGTQTYTDFQNTATEVLQGILAAGVPPARVLISGVAPVWTDPLQPENWTCSLGIEAAWSAACGAAGVPMVSLIDLFTYGAGGSAIDPTLYYDGAHYSTKGWKTIINPLLNNTADLWRAKATPPTVPIPLENAL